MAQNLTCPVCLILSFSCTLPILALYLKFLVVSLTSEPILRPPIHHKQAHTHCVNSSPPGRRHQDALKGARRFIERKAKERWNREEHCQAALTPRNPASGYNAELRHLSQPMESLRARTMGQKWPKQSPLLCSVVGWMQTRRQGFLQMLGWIPVLCVCIHVTPNFVWQNLRTLHFKNIQFGFCTIFIHTHLHMCIHIYIKFIR